MYNRRYYVEKKPGTIYGGDFSPTDNRKFALPVFTFSPDRKSIWAAILEKAYAKYYGQFEVIEGEECFSPYASLFDTLMYFSRRGACMCCLSGYVWRTWGEDRLQMLGK